MKSRTAEGERPRTGQKPLVELPEADLPFSQTFLAKGGGTVSGPKRRRPAAAHARQGEEGYWWKDSRLALAARIVSNVWAGVVIAIIFVAVASSRPGG